MKRVIETAIAVCIAVLFGACGLTATQKTGITKDAVTLAVIEQRCEAAQKAAGGAGGLRAAVDAQCEADLDAFDRDGAKPVGEILKEILNHDEPRVSARHAEVLAAKARLGLLTPPVKP